jgi:hypothetical protein
MENVFNAIMALISMKVEYAPSQTLFVKLLTWLPATVQAALQDILSMVELV